MPGAVYTWSFERVVGRWGISLSDRVLRFTAASAVFLAVFFAPIYFLRSEYMHHRLVENGRVLFENRISDGSSLPWWLFLLPFAYFAIPAILGTAAGRAVRAQTPFFRAIGRAVAGRDPAPRAWDYVFTNEPAAAVRMKLKDDGPWLGGFFGSESYAAGYPEEPQDLYLERTFAMDQNDGSFISDDDGRPDELGTSLLIRWSEVQFLEFFEEA
jgi:Family of unknown function (DUF6338)